MDIFLREECPPVNYLTKVGTLIKNMFGFDTQQCQNDIRVDCFSAWSKGARAKYYLSTHR